MDSSWADTGTTAASIVVVNPAVAAGVGAGAEAAGDVAARRRRASCYCRLVCSIWTAVQTRTRNPLGRPRPRRPRRDADAGGADWANQAAGTRPPARTTIYAGPGPGARTAAADGATGARAAPSSFP